MSVSAIIMAGGKGTRFAGADPKCLARLPDGTTLLTRLIAQLSACEIETSVCCSSENAARIRSALENQRIGAKAIACFKCSLGPLPALGEAIAKTSSQWLLLCLADIYYHTNPFSELHARMKDHPHVEGWLFAGADCSQSRTGWIVRNDSIVKSISYSQSAGADVRWAGGFLFHKRHAGRLTSRASEYANKPFEAWIQDLIEAGYTFGWINAGTFVNVNSLNDYAGLLELAQPDHENDVIRSACH